MRRELIYAAVVGGCVGALMTMALGLVLPLGAQNEARDAEFGTITCTELNVVNSAGKTLVWLNTGGVDWVEDRNGELSPVGHERGGRIMVYGENGTRVHLSGSVLVAHRDFGYASMSINEHGGQVYVLGKDGLIGDAGSVRIENDEHGGKVRVLGKGEGAKGEVKIAIDEDGGKVRVAGVKDDEDIQSYINMGIGKSGPLMFLKTLGSKSTVFLQDSGIYLSDKSGKEVVQIVSNGEHGGSVGVKGKEGQRGAQMNIDEHGGAFSAYGRGNQNSRVGMGVNEYGNGAVSTWDKNGYRLATLK